MPLKPESGPVCDLHGSVWDEGALLLLLRLHEVSHAIAKSMSHLKQPIETKKSLGDALTPINTAWGCAHKHGGKLGLGFIQSGDRKRNAGGEFGTWLSILCPNRKFGKVFDWLFYFTSVCCVKGVESSAAAAGPGHPPARRHKCDADAAKPTKRPEGETGSGSFGLAWAPGQDCLVPGQHVSVTVDVQVSHCRGLCNILVRLKQFRVKWLKNHFFARVSLEASRLPRSIYNAQCLTSGCLSLHSGEEDASLEATPIYYQTLVLHRWANDAFCKAS